MGAAALTTLRLASSKRHPAINIKDLSIPQHSVRRSARAALNSRRFFSLLAVFVLTLTAASGWSEVPSPFLAFNRAYETMQMLVSEGKGHEAAIVGFESMELAESVFPRESANLANFFLLVTRLVAMHPELLTNVEHLSPTKALELAQKNLALNLAMHGQYTASVQQSYSTLLRIIYKAASCSTGAERKRLMKLLRATKKLL